MRDDPKFVRPLNAHKLHEVSQVDFVRAPGTLIVNVREPFNFWRHLGQPLKFWSSQETICRQIMGSADEVVLRPTLIVITYFTNTRTNGQVISGGNRTPSYAGHVDSCVSR